MPVGSAPNESSFGLIAACHRSVETEFAKAAKMGQICSLQKCPKSHLGTSPATIRKVAGRWNAIAASKTVPAGQAYTISIVHASDA
jgi:hypothetical protein